MFRKHWITICVVIICVLYGIQIVWDQTHHVSEIPILGYHHIVEDCDKELYYKHNMWVNSLSSFEEQMKLLHDKGYHSVSLDDVYEWRMGRKKLDDKSVVITFDDGFYSAIKYAQPVLEKYGFDGYSFVIGSLIAPHRKSYQPDIRQHATLADMKDVSHMEFYSHSYDLHHKKGGFKVNLLNEKQLQEDTKKAAACTSIEYYAYPYGKYNDTIQKVLKKSGTKLAFGFNENRKAKITDNPYALPRFNVDAYTKLDVFYQMVSQ